MTTFKRGYLFGVHVWRCAVMRSAVYIVRVMVVCGICSSVLRAQTMVSLESALRQAEQSALAVRIAQNDADIQSILRRTATDIGKTVIGFQQGQISSIERDNLFTITQNIPFPTLFSAQSDVYVAQEQHHRFKLKQARVEITAVLRSLYYRYAVAQERLRLLRSQDSVVLRGVRNEERRRLSGDATSLEESEARLQAADIHIQIMQTEYDMQSMTAGVRALLATQTNLYTNIRLEAPQSLKRLLRLPADTTALQENPSLAIVRQAIALAQARHAVEIAKTLPEFSIGYFTQSIIGSPLPVGLAGSSPRFSGFQVGVAVPVWFLPSTARIEAVHTERLYAEYQAEQYRVQLQAEYQRAVLEYTKAESVLNLHEQSMLPQARKLQDNAEISYRRGDINYIEYAMIMRRIFAMFIKYCDALDQYNQAVITIEALAGQ